MNKWIFFIMALLLVSFASAETFKIGKQSVEYDQVIEYESMNSYYKGDTLVLSTFDDNKDGEIDQWFIYTEGFVVQSAMRDSDSNGKPDYFVEYDKEGNAVSERVAGTFFKELGKTIWKYKLYIIGAFVLLILIVVIVKIKKRKTGKKQKHEEHHKDRRSQTGKQKDTHEKIGE